MQLASRSRPLRATWPVSSHLNDPHQPRRNTAKTNKTYGFHAEAELLGFLRDHGFVVERLVLAGDEDEGDFTLTVNNMLHIVQLKTYTPRTRTGDERSPSMAQVQRWLKALKEQQKNYTTHRKLQSTPGGLLILRAKGTSWQDALIVQSMGNWMTTTT